MKVLWTCNIAIPDIARIEKKRESVTGGWLTGISSGLLNENCHLIVCCPLGDNTTKGEIGENLRYYSFVSSKKYLEAVERRFLDILRNENPDIIHIFGSEYPHSLCMVKAAEQCGLKGKVVLSIQGLVSICANHFYADVPLWTRYGFTLRDIYRHENLAICKKDFERRGEFEKRTIRSVDHVIGRTEWDRACAIQINRNINYHSCNEILRASFYKYAGTWNYQKCEPHSIFATQFTMPLKGFHYILKSLQIVKEFYPDVKIYITGKNLFSSSIKSIIKKSMYDVYITKLIKQNRLKDNVVFLDELTESEMCRRMLLTNVFVCCSSIENSPNSLCEAMMLGVPCVASDVGGIKSIFRDNIDGFVYQHNAHYMLAHYIIEMFSSIDKQKEFSQASAIHASNTHSIKNNTQTLLSIYENINCGR